MCGHNEEGSTPRPSKLGWRKDMELSPSLGLGTIYIVSFWGMIDHTTRVWVRSLRTAWESVRHLKSPDP